MKRARKFSKRKGVCRIVCIACVGGGSNAIGMFHAFLKMKACR